MKAVAGSLLLLLLAAGCLSSPSPEAPPAGGSGGAGPRLVPAGNSTDGLPPHAPPPAKVGSLAMAAAGDAPSGIRIRLWNDRAYVTTGFPDDGIAIFDVSDPFQPVRLGSVAGIAPREGLDVLNYGERVVVVASVGGFTGGEMAFFDVTRPEDPVELRRIPMVTHTLAVLRSAHVVYNGGWATGAMGGTEVVDASDPDDIKVRKWEWGARAEDGTPLQPSGCHDLLVDQAARAAYCAGQGQTTVWDLGDPLQPRVRTAITTPTLPHHNTAFPILGGKVLVISEEESGCSPEEVPAGAPNGLWFYDLATSPPMLLSWLSVPSDWSDRPGMYGICAPHFGSEVVQGSGVLAFGWFDAGLVLVDASDPRQPRVVDQDLEDRRVSDAVSYRGLVFAAADDGGLQVAVPQPAAVDPPGPGKVGGRQP